jgi:hypothetical protein
VPARQKFAEFMESTFLLGEEWRLLDDSQMNHLATLFRQSALSIERWLKIPPKGREKLSLEELFC